MLEFLRDRWETARLQARCRRIVHQQTLQFLERQTPLQEAGHDGGWLRLGDGGPVTAPVAAELRTQARALVSQNPHAQNILRLLEIYTVGPGFELSHIARDTDAGTEVAAQADRVWRDFLEHNRRHFSYREFARRAWRDGETFLRLYPARAGAPSVRFIDPEAIGPTTDDPRTQGILTDPDDVETARFYLRLDPASGELRERIPAELLLHVRYGVDSNQKRGISLFAPLIEPIRLFEKWMETEMQARRLQASIVLWRKVQGSAAQAASLADTAASATAGSEPVATGPRRENYRPGTILTTSQGTDLQFLQPNTNFGDAVPLGRAALLCIAAGAGLPEFMLSSDASNANYSSTMVAEGPAVKMFQSEQQFFAEQLLPLWRRVLTQAVDQGELPPDVFERVAPNWNYPQLVSRDRARERTADARLVDAGILSRAEVARRDNVDPAVMQRELSAEQDRPREERPRDNRHGE